MLQSVLFDLDGLLVDSEPLQFRAYRKALAEFGYQLDIDSWIEWHRVEASTARWIRDQQLDLDPEALRSVKREYYETLIASELELKSGAQQLIEDCANSFKIAVVSSSRGESIAACMQKFGLDRHFTSYVSGADLPRSKPYPDVYLQALNNLTLESSCALALEDSVTGFRAASAAGIQCIVCPDHFIPKPGDAFVGAALVVDSLCELDAERLRNIHRMCHNGRSA